MGYISDISPEEKFEHYKRQIEHKKEQLAQTQGMLNMVKRQLAEMGINSKAELEAALSEAKTKFEAARVDYTNKMKDFEETYGDYFRN